MNELAILADQESKMISGTDNNTPELQAEYYEHLAAWYVGYSNTSSHILPILNTMLHSTISNFVSYAA